jgi:uncharacterized protein (TIGR00251 family)
VALDVKSTSSGAIRFAVRVQPRASTTAVAGVHGGALRVRLQAPPVDGAANDALVAFLASSLGLPKRSVRIVAGLASRTKTIEVSGATAERVQALAKSE